MKKFFTAVLALVATACIAQSSMAQSTDWTKTFPSKIKWYRITDAGVLVVGTNDALYGISPADGKEIWKIDDIENIQEENYDPQEGTPYIVLAKHGLTRSGNNVVDVVTGRRAVNTRDLGLANLTKR